MDTELTSIIPDDGRMKPILILPPDTVSDADVKELRDTGLCVVVAKDPAAVKFMDPLPAVVGRTKVEDAAIAFSRKILDPKTFIRNNAWVNLGRTDVATLFVDILVSGSVLDPLPSATEVERQLFTQAKRDEIQRIAREEAREEAAQRREEKKKAKAAK